MGRKRITVPAVAALALAGAPIPAGVARAQAVPKSDGSSPIIVLPGSGGAGSASSATPASATPPPGAVALPKITVLTSPLAGSSLDIAKAPASVQTFSSKELSASGAPSAVTTLEQRAAGVSLSSASGNSRQPSLFYHGYEISPLQGTSQGLAVYVNGVRFNQPFGDTVDWDLLPDVAIRSMAIEDANPVFGLNALGGAVNVQMKNGFTYHGGEAEVYGGSYGTARGHIQYGAQAGHVATYLALSLYHQGGWRQDQSSDIQNFYGDIGWRNATTEIHANLTLANSTLNGPGTSPVQLLAVDPAAQYTAPNEIANRYLKFVLTATHRLGGDMSVSALSYYDYFLQRVANGNAPNDTPCYPGAPYLCQAPGVLSTTRGGVPIPNFRADGLYSELDRQTTNTNGYGGALQFTDDQNFAGLGNHFLVGASFEAAQTEFSGRGIIGGITPLSRVFAGPGIVIDEPGTNVPVQVGIHNAYAGFYVSDTLDLTKALSVTASARANLASIDLGDQGGGGQGGGSLTGNHYYTHLNPSIGATWKITPLAILFGGYSVANRTPTPAELSCAGPENSCSLANFFVGDPNLKQVVARNFELGLRGAAPTPGGGTLSYTLDAYRSNLADAIAFVNSSAVGRAYFANVGGERRQGVDLKLDLEQGPVHAWFDYSRVDATYQTGFVEAAGANPAANAEGNIDVRPGDHLPGIPRNQFKFGAEWQATPKLSVGATAVATTSRYLFGDAANLTAPLPGYVTVNLRAHYRVNERLELLAAIDNVTDATYYTYGTFSSLGDVRVAQVPGLTNPRAYSIAAPIGGFVGLRMKF